METNEERLERNAFGFFGWLGQTMGVMWLFIEWAAQSVNKIKIDGKITAYITATDWEITGAFVFISAP